MDGVVSWGDSPLFLYKWSNDNKRLTSITYATSDEIDIKEHIVITPAFSLVNPYSHYDAAFEHVGSEINISRQLLPPGVGPNKFKLDDKGRHLHKLAEIAIAEITEQTQRIGALCDGDDVELGARNKRLRSEALEKPVADRVIKSSSRPLSSSDLLHRMPQQC